MRILGIDPGLNITGYGVIEISGNVESSGLVEAGVIRTQASDRLEDRLVELAREIGEVIAQFRPDAMSVEELYSHYAHPRTAIVMGHARGVAFLKAAEAGVAVFAYASTKVKSCLTGNGRATKAQMQAMICSTFALSAPPEPADAADALAIALCHARTILHSEAVPA